MRSTEQGLGSGTQFVAESGGSEFIPVALPGKLGRGLVAHYLERSRIRVAHAPVLVDHDADDRRFDEGAIAFLALAQGALRGDPVGDVAGND